MKNITKRDLLFFVVGLVAMSLIESAYNWRETTSSIKRGFNDGYNANKE